MEEEQQSCRQLFPSCAQQEKRALRIFLRLAESSPLVETAPTILDYLNLCFFSATYEHLSRQGPASGDIDLSVEIAIHNSIVLMLEDFGVLPPNRAKQRACLHLADLYGLGTHSANSTTCITLRTGQLQSQRRSSDGSFGDSARSSSRCRVSTDHHRYAGQSNSAPVLNSFGSLVEIMQRLQMRKPVRLIT